MSQRSLVFRTHAVKRMFERGISVAEIRSVLETGDVIEEYPNDRPYPSRLMLGWIQTRPLHVVAADVPGSNEVIVITVYQPNLETWDTSFRERR